MTKLAETTLQALNPRTGEADYSFEPASPADVAELARDLRINQPAWVALGIEGRAAAMRRWADAIEAAATAIGDAEEADTGRRRLSHEVPLMVAGAVRRWCDQAPGVLERARLQGTSSTTDTVTYDTEFDPYPLLGVISPWNHPFLLSTLDAIPALLAGCAAIVKPSEVTPRFVDPVMETIGQVPELGAVFTYVLGAAETGQALIDEIDVLCFTGSVPTGRKLAVRCAERFIPAFLELGGKDAAIVTAAADPEAAAAAVLKGGVHNTGQICFATERVYVDAELQDEFVDALTRQAAALELTYPDPAAGHIGPFILRRQADIVDAHLADALARGATLRSGGPSQELGGGRYMEPTVLTGVTHEMAIMREETFGPVLPVMAYETIEEGLELANDSEYGLSGAVIGGSAEEAAEVAGGLNAGAISLQDTSLTINIMSDVEKTSYGHSGLGGSRMGPNALLRFLRRKALIARHGPVLGMTALGEQAPGA
jgi:succinate-semialdehyde dehydrogenase / glutarate-semialdehyde dehydrogenase